MKRQEALLLAAVLLGLAVYLVLFFAAPLPSLAELTGFPWRRFHLFRYLLLPDELAAAWFGSPPQFAILDRLPVLGLAALILAWAGLLGWVLLRLLRADGGLDRLERFVFSMGVGLNAVSTWVLAVGLAGRLDRLVAFILPAVLTAAVAAWLYRRRPVSVISGQVEPDKREACSTEVLSARWLWLAAPLVLVILLGGMLPPAEFDVREYHLQAPKEFFQQGRIDFLPHNLYANMALGTEMLSLLGMVVSGDWWLGALVGKTIIALFAPLGALALFAAGRRWFSTTAGVVAAVLYLSTGWIAQVSNYGMVEGASALYLFLAAYAVLLGCRGNAVARKRDAYATPTPLFALAGYCAGAAVASKYPAVLFVALPLPLALLAIHFRNRQGAKEVPSQFPRGTGFLTRPGRLGKAVLRHSFLGGSQAPWKPVAVFLLACAVGCGLWFAKNWALTGNPTYPLMYRLFGGKTWTAEKNDLWNRVHRPHDFSSAALGKDLTRVVLGSEWLGPLLMPLAALAFLRRENRRLATLLAAYFGFVIAVWWLTALRIDRYWLPALPLAALLAGAGACWSQERAWRYVLVGLLALHCVYGFFVAAGGPGGYNRYFAGLAQLRTAPERVDPWHRYFNTHVTKGKLLLVGEAQVFDLEVPILYNTWLDDSIFERLTKDRTPEEIRAALHEEGISHVFVHWGEIARYRRTGYGRWDYAQPERFDRLVAAGVLESLSEIENHVGRGYLVK